MMNLTHSETPNFAALLRQMGRQACDMSEQEAHDLFAALLDGGVPDLEMGALLYAVRTSGETLNALLGFQRAMESRMYFLTPPDTTCMPMIVPAYGGVSGFPNLLPVLALLLARFGIPVLMHGTLENRGGVAAAYVLRELDVLPCSTLDQAQRALEKHRIAYVPTATLCPGLSSLLALRSRLGLHNSAHFMVKLLDPFRGSGLRLIGAGTPDYLARLKSFVLATESAALLLQSTEGEAFANPFQRPRIEWLRDGGSETLFEAELHENRNLPYLPASQNIRAVSHWSQQVLRGEAALPQPLANQLACCLYATGYAQDFNQAKAIVAVETGCLATA